MREQQRTPIPLMVPDESVMGRRSSSIDGSLGEPLAELDADDQIGNAGAQNLKGNYL